MLYIMLRKYKSWYLLCYTLHYIQIDLSAAPCNGNKVAFISFMRCCHIFHQSTAIEKISELIILLVEANWCSTVPLQCTVPPSQFYLLLLSCGLVMLLTVKILKIRSPNTIGLIYFHGMISGVDYFPFLFAVLDTIDVDCDISNFTKDWRWILSTAKVGRNCRLKKLLLQ